MQYLNKDINFKTSTQWNKRIKQTKNSINTEVNGIIQALNQKFISMATEEIKASKKLSIYKSIKRVFRMEPYLKHMKEFQYRSSITKIRLSNHTFPIELGRHLGIPRDQRFCTRCNSDAIGDEFHVIMHCQKNKECREKYLKEILKICPQLLNFNYAQIFKYLLCCSDMTILKATGKLFNDCIETSKVYIN